MKKPILISAVAALTIANPGMTAVASSLGSPVQEATHAIISQQPVDEHAIQAAGTAYADAYLAAFRQLSTTYQQAFEQGVADGQRGRQQLITGTVSQVAYQRGWTRGQQLRIAAAGNDRATTAASLGGASVPNDNLGAMPSTPTDERANGTGTPDQNDYALQAASNDQRTFINRLAPAARQVGAEYDLYPSVIIAQAALESNWGTSRLSRAPFHNMFGVKGYFAGQTTSQPTSEYLGGHRLMVVDNFRRYQSDTAALRDYAENLQAPLYRGVHRQYAATYRQATHALQGRYATDPQYEQKLNQLIDGYRLTRYDHQPRHAGTGQQSPVKIKLATEQPSHRSHTATPSHQQRRHRHLSTVASVISGLGSAGLVELGRRLFLK